MVWQLDYKNGAGKRRRHDFSSKQAAEKEFSRVVREELQAKPETSVASEITVEEFAKTWLLHVAPTISEKTLASYRQILKLYILPVIGQERMLSLHEGTVGNLLSSWTTAGKSANTVRLIRATLSVIFADAADTSSPLHLLSRNPVTLAGGRRHRRAERKRQKAERQKRVRVLGPRQRDALLAEAAKEGIQYEALFSYMADAGPRPSEALALRWDQIDFKNGTAWIWATKTSTERTVDLSPRSLTALKRLRTAQQQLAPNTGAGVPDLCFPNGAGRVVDQSRLAKTLKHLLRRAGVSTAHGLYDLRHTYATIALAEGKPPTYVAEQIGDSVETLHRWYAHWFPRRGKAGSVSLARDHRTAV